MGPLISNSSANSSSVQHERNPVLAAGGSGFFGGNLKWYLSDRGVNAISLDLEHDEDRLLGLLSVQGDSRDRSFVEELFNKRSFKAVYHAAAQLACHPDT